MPPLFAISQSLTKYQITEAVHAKGSFIYLQLWALGRCAYVEHLAGDPYVSSSPKKLETLMHIAAAPRTDDVPREMTMDEIKEYSQLFSIAASNAVHNAGFDGVEIHAANGYLLEQFLMDTINERMDSYGGSVENRARFPLEVVDAVVSAVGPTKTAIRLSPWNTKQRTFVSPDFAKGISNRLISESGMVDPKLTYAHVVTEIRDRHPDLAYIHVCEPPPSDDATASNDFIREIWGERVLISAGGYGDTRESGFRAAEEKGDLVAYSRAFIANVGVPPLLAGVSAEVFSSLTFRVVSCMTFL